MDGDLTPEKIQRLVESATNPVAHYRRQICRRLARQTYNQFGIDGLMDLLTGIDDAGRFSSVVVIDRDEIDNFLFETYGIFDPDMFEKVQMTDEWDEFIAETIERSGMVIGRIIDSIVREN
jgi:hypothetical protein